MGFPYPPSGKCRGNACRHAGKGVEREGGVMLLAEQRQALLAEGGEGGEPSAKPRGEEKPCLVGEAEAGGEGVEQPDEEASRHVDAERSPREEKGRDAPVHHRLHPEAHHASDAASQEYGYQCVGHVVYLRFYYLRFF